MKKPVLFTIFNRPKITLETFKEIAKAKPPRIYIASDGARHDKEGELKKVKNLRKEILEKIEWDCKVETLFRSKNLGCRNAMSESINWFFENEEDGIILEDDCLPDSTFFSFCENLLDKYKDNKEVMHISGNQFLNDFNTDDSYYFAKIEHCWGWASWSDRWKKYKYGTNLSDFDDSNLIKFSTDPYIQKYWLNILNKMKAGEIDSWAYQWTFRIIENNGICINPSVNLISNIGFGEDGTHTVDKKNKHANMDIFPIDEIIHPTNVAIDDNYVNRIYKEHFSIKSQEDFNQEILSKIRSIENINRTADIIQSVEWKFYSKIIRIIKKIFPFKIYRFLRKVLYKLINLKNNG